MNIENQVCTFHQAKRLKELGVGYPKGQESFFKWFECDIGESWEPGLFRPDSGEFDYMLIGGLEGDYSDEVETRGNWDAFTVAELGVMLGATAHYLQRSDRNDYWYVYLDTYKQFKTEAEGRAAMLIFRLEVCAITAAEANHLLKSA